MSALLIVDVQYDFLQGGALAIPDGERVIPVINRLMESKTWTCICATQDFHPANHVSFARNHVGDQTEIDIYWNGEVQRQRLWPVHCVQGTKGCQLHDDLKLDNIDKVFQKGYNSKLDSYSGFADSFHHEETGLHKYLQEKNITDVYVVGVAEDYCVLQTALASANLGYNTKIVKAAVAGISPLTDNQRRELSDAGVTFVSV